MSRSPQPPEFFLDRNLGRLRVAAALRERGWIVRTHYDVFGRRDQQVADVEWLEYCGRENLPVLSKDRRLRYRPEEIAAVRRHRIRAFILMRGSLRAAEQAARFDGNHDAIVEACANRGPFIYAVQIDGLKRIFP